jgi:hypothetical protein
MEWHCCLVNSNGWENALKIELKIVKTTIFLFFLASSYLNLLVMPLIGHESYRTTKQRLVWFSRKVFCLNIFSIS